MTRSLFLSLSVLLISSLVFAAAETATVAVVGNKTISVDEFNRRYEDVKRQALFNPPSKKVFLEDLVRYELGIQEAEKRGLAKDPQVAERMRQELYKGLLEKDLASKAAAIQVTDSEMKDFYKNSPELRTQHILVEIKASANAAERAAARKRADEIYSEVSKSKRPFEELVTLYTDDLLTKKNAGDVGFQTRMTVSAAYYDAAYKLKEGEISPIVETPLGFHIIKLTKKNSFAASNKRALKFAVFEKKKVALFNEYFEKVKKNYKVSVNLDVIK